MPNFAKKMLMGLLDFLGFGKKRKTIEEYRKRGAIIVDVRSQAEYDSGHVEGSLNVPLDRVKHKVSKLKNLNKPIIFCCASGMRSGSATSMLRKEGLDCINGGSWRSLT